MMPGFFVIMQFRSHSPEIAIASGIETFILRSLIFSSRQMLSLKYTAYCYFFRLAVTDDLVLRLDQVFPPSRPTDMLYIIAGIWKCLQMPPSTKLDLKQSFKLNKISSQEGNWPLIT